MRLKLLRLFFFFVINYVLYLYFIFMYCVVGSLFSVIKIIFIIIIIKLNFNLEKKLHATVHHCTLRLNDNVTWACVQDIIVSPFSQQPFVPVRYPSSYTRIRETELRDTGDLAPVQRNYTRVRRRTYTTYLTHSLRYKILYFCTIYKIQL